MQILKKSFLAIIISLYCSVVSAQLMVNPALTAQDLAQKLVGGGVVISNVSFTGNIEMTGFFNNVSGTNINIDSGIILTSGRSKTTFVFTGTDGDGFTQASNKLANNSWNLPGDPDLNAATGFPGEDACVLEFDFIPLGDSIRFNYIFSSEEYTPAFACPGGGGFNDAFAFFISGPGIAGLKNIALVPNTTLPVSIFNINNVVNSSGIPICPNNPQYFVNNTQNVFFTHDGHTTVLTALEQVQPCQTYHLKLVIQDVGDDQYDSGVFLQAKSLSSNVIQLTPTTQTTPQNQNYLVEGCVPGSFDIKRDQNDPAPLNITLTYSGTATNGVDVQTLPASVVIPANQSAVTVNVLPVVDNIPEGIETLVIYALAGCTSGPPSDSLVIQIRDYDTLGIVPRTAVVCKGGQIQLVAAGGYNTYQWNPDPTLNNTNIPNPVASPTATSTTYICTANQNNCNARDSAVIFTKDIDFISKTDINCNGNATGEIRVGAGNYWIRPVEFSINGGPWQPDSTFTNLPAGTYTIRVRDISGCIDNLTVDIIESPALVISNIAVIAASCSGAADGTVTVTATGGQPPYTYSSNGVNYQPGNVLNLLSNNYVISVKDNAGCITTSNVSVPLNNTVTVDAGADVQICENTSYIIPAVSNASQFSWTPAGTLQNSNTLNPTASPAAPTEYFITATSGICSAVDSITIDIRPAPVADAGPDANICSGQTVQLNGSGGTGFEWSPSNYFQSPTNISNPFVRPTSTFTYALVVTDQFNCRSLTADSVTITVIPTVRISAGRDTIVALNQPLQLNAFEIGNAGVTQFTWSPGLYLSDPMIANPIAVFPVPVMTAPYEYYYTVTGTTPDGCEGTAGIRIRVYKGPDIYVPSGFSPNNDGKNDLLRPIPVGIKELRSFRVFNRWGQLIFSVKDASKGWDGKINGVEQATGTFIWIAEGVDYNGNIISRKGTTTIIR